MSSKRVTSGQKSKKRATKSMYGRYGKYILGLFGDVSTRYMESIKGAEGEADGASGPRTLRTKKETVVVWNDLATRLFDRLMRECRFLQQSKGGGDGPKTLTHNTVVYAIVACMDESLARQALRRMNDAKDLSEESLHDE